MSIPATGDKASLRTAGHAILGHTGDLSGEAFMDGLRTLRFTGTLALNDQQGSMLFLLAKGQVEASFRLGPYGNLDATLQRFHLYPHEPTDLPRLPARDPASGSLLLRALPRMGPAERMRPGTIQLAKLFERLADARFHGAISYREKDGPALALLVDGSVRAAVHESAGRLNSHAEALRALQRAEQPRAKGDLELEALDASLMMPIAALAMERTAPASPNFSGLEVTDAGFRYWKAGQPFLLVPGETRGPHRRYALAEEGVTETPEIEMPSEPAGWEQQRFLLTLRGRDALDTMMELNMRFRAEHGSEGTRVLEALGGGETLERTAAALGLELGKLKPWLERFEAEGLIRLRGR